VQVLPSPVEFPRMVYYQLWHERTHSSNAGRWLREQIKGVAASLPRLEIEAA
jgi:DNA-binding transcriptional LysR family regulator